MFSTTVVVQACSRGGGGVQSQDRWVYTTPSTTNMPRRSHRCVRIWTKAESLERSMRDSALRCGHALGSHWLASKRFLERQKTAVRSSLLSDNTRKRLLGHDHAWRTWYADWMDPVCGARETSVIWWEAAGGVTLRLCAREPISR